MLRNQPEGGLPCTWNARISFVSLTGRSQEGQRAKGGSAEGPRERKPKLGQHFLADDSAATRIVDALGDISQSTVLEIGPGRGVLTSLLARQARRLIAIELDRVLAAQLRMKFALYPNVEIIEGDVLAIDFCTLFGPKPGASRPGLVQTPEPVRVCRESALLHHVRYPAASVRIPPMLRHHRHHGAEGSGRPAAADPGTRDYGLLSATAQLYAEDRETVHASAGSVFSATEGAFLGGTADACRRSSIACTSPKKPSSSFSNSPSDRNARRSGTI